MEFKDELYDYYIKENHTVKECLKRFNLKQSRFYAYLHEYGFSKPTANTLISKISKEDVFRIYCEEDRSFKDLVAYYNTTSDIMRKILKDFKISKSQYILENKTIARNILTEQISKPTLENYYITENHCIEDTLNHFNISQNDLIILLNKYNLKKYSEYKYKSKSFAEYLTILPIDLYKKEYLDNNLSMEDICEKYHVSLTYLLKLNKKYKIEKPKDLIWETAKKSKLNNSKVLGDPQIFKTYSEEFQKMYYDKDLSLKFLDVNPRFKAAELAERFNCKPINIFGWVKRLGLREYIQNELTHYETEIIEYLKTLVPDIKVLKNYRKALPSGKELDIYLPDYKLAIEFNGTYWHSDAIISDHQYHFKKSKEAEKNNIHLVHIFEYEWNNQKSQDLIKTMLKLFLGIIPNKISANKCEIKQITNLEAKSFNEANHLQGHRNAQVTYGLFYNSTLVQLMSFSKTKYNRNLKDNNSWEIIRGCPGSLNLVVGGVSKLFTHFVRDYNPSQVFSYCDFNKFTGISYEKLGMEFIGYTGPDKKYIINDKVFNRNPHQYQKYKDKIQYTLYRAGSKKYLWIKPLKKS